MELTSDLILKAYAAGIFPMAEHQEATELYWFHPATGHRLSYAPLAGQIHAPHTF